MHPSPQVWPVCLCGQMKLVSHQYKAQDPRFKTLPRFAEQLEEVSAIALISQSRPARVASRAQMIDCVFKFYA